MGFGVRLFAVLAPETAQAVTMFTEALALDIASATSHRFDRIFCAQHGNIIQRALVVCQVKCDLLKARFSTRFNGADGGICTRKPFAGWRF